MMNLIDLKKMIGTNVSYMGINSELNNVRQLKEGMFLGYLNNGIIVNVILLKDEKGIYLDDKLIKNGDVQVST